MLKQALHNADLQYYGERLNGLGHGTRGCQMQGRTQRKSPCTPSSANRRPLLEIRDTFFEIEEKLDLFAQRIDGARFWEYIRFTIFIELQRHLGLIDLPTFQQNNLIKKTISFVPQSFGALARNPLFFLKKKPLLFIGGSRRILEDNGEWWNIYADYLLDSLPLDYYYLEKFEGNSHRTPAKSKHILYHDMLSALALICRTGKRIALATKDELLLAEIESQFADKFGVRVGTASIAKSILGSRKYLLPLYERTFKKIQPEIVFLVSVNYQDRIAIEACKRLGITTVELQHGVIGPCDMGYAFPSGAGIRLFPDYLLTFGQYWNDCMPFPISKDRILPIGFPFLERSKQKYSHEQKLDQILFLSQPTIGGSLSQFAARLAQREDYATKIAYRLHPDETDWRSRYPWLEQSDIEVSEAGQQDLYALFAQSTCQAGVYSTALFEGLAFGLKTFVVDLPGCEFLHDLVARKMAFKVADAQQLADNREKCELSECSYFFRQNAQRHFQDALSIILDHRRGSNQRAA